MKTVYLPAGSRGGKADPKRTSSILTPSTIKPMRAAGRGRLHLRQGGRASFPISTQRSREETVIPGAERPYITTQERKAGANGI